jgi:transcriptional regulator GlxA family with amidase domain
MPTGRFDVRLVTLTECDNITASHGAQIRPHGVLSESPDLLIVPGGGWNDRRPQGARAEAERGELPRATAARHAGAAVIADARVVDDGDLLSAGGVTSGLDLAVWIIERELGPESAAAAARELEYDRAGAMWRGDALLTPG